jgi:hypothetical protein
MNDAADYINAPQAHLYIDRSGQRISSVCDANTAYSGGGISYISRGRDMLCKTLWRFAIAVFATLAREGTS